MGRKLWQFFSVGFGSEICYLGLLFWEELSDSGARVVGFEIDRL